MCVVDEDSILPEVRALYYSRRNLRCGLLVLKEELQHRPVYWSLKRK